MALDDKTITGAANIIAALVPALGPYGPVIALGISVLEKVAPVVYNEIVTLIHQIQSGKEVTEEDTKRLEILCEALKNPGNYFA